MNSQTLREMSIPGLLDRLDRQVPMLAGPQDSIPAGPQGLGSAGRQAGQRALMLGRTLSARQTQFNAAGSTSKAATSSGSGL